MSTLIIFIIVALLFAITLAVFILLPWLQTQDHHAIANRADNQLLTLNIEVFKQHWKETFPEMYDVMGFEHSGKFNKFIENVFTKLPKEKN